MIEVARFYSGILIVVVAFLLCPYLKIRRWHLYSFSGLIAYEFITSNIFQSVPFFYGTFDDLGISSVSRASIGGSIYRTFGPTLNSSVSGSICAILFFFVLRSTIQGRYHKKRGGRGETFLSLIIFVSFVFSGSGTCQQV